MCAWSVSMLAHVITFEDHRDVSLTFGARMFLYKEPQDIIARVRSYGKLPRSLAHDAIAYDIAVCDRAGLKIGSATPPPLSESVTISRHPYSWRPESAVAAAVRRYSTSPSTVLRAWKKHREFWEGCLKNPQGLLHGPTEFSIKIHG
jgi:hypothetical protein